MKKEKKNERKIRRNESINEKEENKKKRIIE